MLSSYYKDTYGALYEDVREAKLPILTAVFHNIRQLVLILLLVSLAPHAFTQATVFTASALISAGWNLTIRPYDGVLVNLQMLLGDVAKLAAGVGYLVLTHQDITSRTAATLLAYEICVFVVSMCLGLVMLIIQTIMGIREWFKDCCCKKEEKVSPMTSVRSSDSCRHLAGAKDE